VTTIVIKGFALEGHYDEPSFVNAIIQAYRDGTLPKEIRDGLKEVAA